MLFRQRVSKNVMPRFRFQWANLPDELQHQLLPDDQKGADDLPGILKRTFGARPKEEFIRDNWTILLESWLKNDVLSSDQLASSLRALGLGDSSIQQNYDYLATCKNTKNLRSYALQAFLDFGERSPASSPQVEAIRQLAVVATPPEEGETLLKNSRATSVVDGDPESDLRNKARAAVGKLFNTPAEDVYVDSDGDVSVRFGSAAVFVRVIMANPLRYSIFSPLLSDVEESPVLYEILNEINKNLIIGSMTVSNSNVVLEYSIISTITMEELSMVIDYITDMADQYDNKLQEYVGGNPFFREKNQDEIDV